MSDLPHGLHYVGRDGVSVWHLDGFFSIGPCHPSDLPRPERDVLAALLRFCIEGIDYLNTRESVALLMPESQPTSAVDR